MTVCILEEVQCGRVAYRCDRCDPSGYSWWLGGVHAMGVPLQVQVKLRYVLSSWEMCAAGRLFQGRREVGGDCSSDGAGVVSDGEVPHQQATTVGAPKKHIPFLFSVLFDEACEQLEEEEDFVTAG